MPRVGFVQNDGMITAEVRVGNKAITVSEAKELLGWTVESGHARFGDDYLLKDEQGRKVRCMRNSRNRPFNETWARTIAQDLLNGNWRFNGESIVIGPSGRILSGQHRLIALVLAWQLWSSAPPGSKWRNTWHSDPVLTTVLVRGVSESDDSTRTLDNVRPRTLADILFTSAVFSDYGQSTRRTVTRIADYAIKFLWQRTGAELNPFAQRRTHSEALDFISRHPKVLDCVKYIYEEDQSLAIRRVIGPGYAAGLMYLQACSASDNDVYRSTDPPLETNLNWDRWDLAEDFWSLPVKKDGFEQVQQALDLAKVQSNEWGSSLHWTTAVLVNAWRSFVNQEELDADRILPDYIVDGNGLRCLTEHPSIGGIDVYGASPDEADEENGSDSSSEE